MRKLTYASRAVFYMYRQLDAWNFLANVNYVIFDTVAARRRTKFV